MRAAALAGTAAAATTAPRLRPPSKRRLELADANGPVVKRVQAVAASPSSAVTAPARGSATANAPRKARAKPAVAAMRVAARKGTPLPTTKKPRRGAALDFGGGSALLAAESASASRVAKRAAAAVTKEETKRLRKLAAAEQRRLKKLDAKRKRAEAAAQHAEAAEEARQARRLRPSAQAETADAASAAELLAATACAFVDDDPDDSSSRRALRSVPLRVLATDCATTSPTPCVEHSSGREAKVAVSPTLPRIRSPLSECAHCRVPPKARRVIASL